MNGSKDSEYFCLFILNINTMYGALIGAGLKAVGSITGAITSARAVKNAQEQLATQQAENEAWYNRRYNEDATQRADAQRMITMVSDSIKKRNRAAAGTAAVMGGTTESVAAAKEANNQALADTTSQIVAAAEARKDNIESQYQARKDALKEKETNMELARAEAIAKAASGVGNNAAAGIGGNLDEAFTPDIKPEDTAKEGVTSTI